MKASRILRWISSSAADAVGRMVLQFFATVLFAHWLEPEVFGKAALTMVGVATLSVFVTAPFEEALSQRRHVRAPHFSTSLAAVLAIGSVLCVLALGVALLAPSTKDRAEWLGPAVFSLILLANGPISILTAVCRRHRRFGDIAKANLIGQTLGTFTGIGLVWLAHADVWGLLAVQFVSRFVALAVLVALARVRPGLRFSLPHLRELSRFAGWHLAGRGIESVSDAIYQILVSTFFGLTANGYLNLAMRIVEPIRGATGAIGHNIATAFFSRAQESPVRFRTVVTDTIGETTLLLLPVFIGLAATSPTIIRLLAGPEWTRAGPLAICLALGAAVGTISNFMHSALSAKGRADLGFYAGLLDFIVMAGFLIGFRNLGLVAIGLARFFPYLTDLVFVTVAAWRAFALPVAPIARTVSITGLNAVLMALAVIAVAMELASAAPVLSLGLQVASGVAVYLALVWILQKGLLQRVLSRLRAPSG